MEKPRENEKAPRTEFRDAVRTTVINRVDDLLDCAFQLQKDEPRFDDMHFVTREPQFGVSCDVVELKVTETEFPGVIADRIRVYRPVVDPALQGYPRSVSYWVELSVTSGTEHSSAYNPGMYLELSTGADKVVDIGMSGGAEVLEFPTEMDVTTGSVLNVVQGMIEQNGHNIVARQGFGPPMGDMGVIA